MWYRMAINKAMGGGIIRKKPAVPPASPTEVPPPKPDYMKTMEEKLKSQQTDGFLQGYTPDILNSIEREPGSAMLDQHEGGWQEYTPEGTTR